MQHCELGRLLATELGLAVNVATALGQAFARWNGTGVPALSGDEIALSMRIALVTEEAERYARARGPKAAVDMVRLRAGHAYDPDLAEIFSRDGEQILSGLDATDCWSAGWRPPCRSYRSTKGRTSGLRAPPPAEAAARRRGRRRRH